MLSIPSFQLSCLTERCKYASTHGCCIISRAGRPLYQQLLSNLTLCLAKIGSKFILSGKSCTFFFGCVFLLAFSYSHYFLHTYVLSVILCRCYHTSCIFLWSIPSDYEYMLIYSLLFIIYIHFYSFNNFLPIQETGVISLQKL